MSYSDFQYKDDPEGCSFEVTALSSVHGERLAVAILPYNDSDPLYIKEAEELAKAIVKSSRRDAAWLD